MSVFLRWSLAFTALVLAADARAQTSPQPDSSPAAATVSPAAPRISFNYIHVDGTFIAMTFDDGPQEKLTPQLLDLLAQHHILDLLAQHHIKATFFVIGQNVDEYPDIVARA